MHDTPAVKSPILLFKYQLLSHGSDLDIFVCNTVSTCRAGVSSAWRDCPSSNPYPYPCFGQACTATKPGDRPLPAFGKQLSFPHTRYWILNSLWEKPHSQWLDRGNQCVGNVGWVSVKGKIGAENGDTLCGHTLPGSPGTGHANWYLNVTLCKCLCKSTVRWQVSSLQGVGKERERERERQQLHMAALGLSPVHRQVLFDQHHACLFVFFLKQGISSGNLASSLKTVEDQAVMSLHSFPLGNN